LIDAGLMSDEMMNKIDVGGLHARNTLKNPEVKYPSHIASIRPSRAYFLISSASRFPVKVQKIQLLIKT